MAIDGKPTIPGVLERFVAYGRENGAWGSLHIVLDDGNVDDDDVAFCVDWAKKERDPEGVALAEILLGMSKTQRKKLPRRVWDVLEAERKARGDM